MRSIDGLVKQRPIRPDDRFRFRFILLKEFNAIVSQSRVSQLLEIFGAGLSARIEQGVPAADVSAQGMLNSHAVAQMHAMLFARNPGRRSLSKERPRRRNAPCET